MLLNLPSEILCRISTHLTTKSWLDLLTTNKSIWKSIDNEEYWDSRYLKLRNDIMSGNGLVHLRLHWNCRECTTNFWEIYPLQEAVDNDALQHGQSAELKPHETWPCSVGIPLPSGTTSTKDFVRALFKGLHFVNEFVLETFVEECEYNLTTTIELMKVPRLYQRDRVFNILDCRAGSMRIGTLCIRPLPFIEIPTLEQLREQNNNDSTNSEDLILLGGGQNQLTEWTRIMERLSPNEPGAERYYGRCVACGCVYDEYLDPTSSDSDIE
jgi:hypothetical protein